MAHGSPKARSLRAPVPNLRGKTQIKEFEAFPTLDQLPLWGFDGSSTNQAEGHASDRVLRPVFSCPDPIRGGDDIGRPGLVFTPYAELVASARPGDRLLLDDGRIELRVVDAPRGERVPLVLM